MIKRKDSQSSFVSMTTNAHGNLLDANRIEKLLQVFTQLAVCKAPTDMIKVLVEELKHLVSYNRATIFAVTHDIKESLDLLTPEKDGVYVFKTFIEGGRGISGVQKSNQQDLPAFQKLDEVMFGIKSQQFLVTPVLFKQSEILLVIQLESRFMKGKNKFVGFHTADEQIIKIISFFIAM